VVVAKAKQHSESGRARSQRKKHDQLMRTYETKGGNPYHLSKNAQVAGAVLIGIVVVAFTALFIGGLIHW
jgi:hypothetical protein